MPGSDASQFTRFKKANAVQRGDTQASDPKSVNRLTQYVPHLTGASSHTLFLSSLRPKPEPETNNITYLDFSGVIDSLGFFTLPDPSFPPNNTFNFKIKNFGGNYNDISLINFLLELGLSTTGITASITGVTTSTLEIGKGVKFGDITGFTSSSIIHITLPYSISKFRAVIITTPYSPPITLFNEIPLDFDRIFVDQNTYTLLKPSFPPLQYLGYNYRFTVLNVIDDPIIYTIILESQNNNFSGAVFTINGIGISPSSIIATTPPYLVTLNLSTPIISSDIILEITGLVSQLNELNLAILSTGIPKPPQV